MQAARGMQNWRYPDLGPVSLGIVSLEDHELGTGIILQGPYFGREGFKVRSSLCPDVSAWLCVGALCLLQLRKRLDVGRVGGRELAHQKPVTGLALWCLVEMLFRNGDMLLEGADFCPLGKFWPCWIHTWACNWAGELRPSADFRGVCLSCPGLYAPASFTQHSGLPL